MVHEWLNQKEADFIDKEQESRANRMKQWHILAVFLLRASAFAAARQIASPGNSNPLLSWKDRTVRSIQKKNRTVRSLQTKSGLKTATEANPGSQQPSPVPMLRLLDNDATKTAVSAIIGTVLTFVSNNILELGPVQASSVVSLLVSLALPEKLAIAAACGSFAGMAKTAVIPTIKESMILGGICASILILCDKKKWLIGVGGRLGFIAQCACTAQFITFSFFRVPSEPAALVGSYPALEKLLLQLPLVSLFTILGAVYMKLWKQVMASQSIKATHFRPLYKRLSTTVAAVGATGLLATITSPQFAGPVFCGSFVAMSSPSKLDSDGAVVGACLLGGLSQQLLVGVLLGGWGGKLGTASLMGVVFYNLLLSAKRQKRF